MAREAGTSAKVVRGYFDLLEDTFLGVRLPPWRRSRPRRLVETDKFYLFDVGVANHLARRRPRIGSPEFGKSFEHWVLMELRAWQAYRAPDLELTFFRTAAGQEVDFLAADPSHPGAVSLAVEVKGSARVHEGDLKGLRTLADEVPVRRRVVVSLEREPRTLDGAIEVLPWLDFVRRLWAGELL